MVTTHSELTYPYPAVDNDSGNFVPATDGGDTVVYEPADPLSGTYPRIHSSNNTANWPPTADTTLINPYGGVVSGGGGGGGGTADPNISSLSPVTAPAGSPVTVTVTGTNFASGATVEVNQAAVSTTFVSATELSATFTPATAGTVTFTVRSGSEESNDVTFTVT